ncbi:hypothetical protein BDW71DRAFT_180922 [Aspergillus fruticulosus]
MNTLRFNKRKKDESAPDQYQRYLVQWLRARPAGCKTLPLGASRGIAVAVAHSPKDTSTV